MSPQPKTSSDVGLADLLTPIVPREFVTKPFFPAKKQLGPRVIEYKGKTWTIGAPRPDGHISPPIDMRHARICLALLTFRKRFEMTEKGGRLQFSINELAHRVAKSNGGRYSRDLLKTIFELRDVWVRYEDPDNKDPDERIRGFSIIGEIETFNRPVRRADALRALERQGELWLDRVYLNPRFFGLLSEYEQLARIRFDILRLMSSDIAQCIYAFIPSRAIHRDASNPFEIRLATLLEQIGLNVPKYRSKRAQIFTQRDPSVIKQLDKVPLLRGRLRVKLAETADGEDYKLQAWAELPEPKRLPASETKSTGGKLLQRWLDSGRQRSEFFELINNAPELTDHQIYLIQKCGAKYRGNEAFFQMVGGLLGSNHLDVLLSEAKGSSLEGWNAKSATKVLIHRLMKAVSGLS